MRTVHWLFVVSVLLFVSGIGFVIAGARAAREAPAAATGPAPEPVATVKQIMKVITDPASMVVFNAVSTYRHDRRHSRRKRPRTDEEWEAVGNSAAALVESGNLLLMGSRRVDNGDWAKYSRDLIEAGKVAMKAARDRSADDVLASGEAIIYSCDNCHKKYQRAPAS